MTESITAPWTTEQVAALNRYQDAGEMHPLTCGNLHADSRSPVLVATPNGWRCPNPTCDYQQDWAHDFMAVTQETHQGPGVYGGLETHRGHRHECPAPDCGPQGVRIVANDPEDDGVHIHFPEVDYLDTQVWSADIGISTAALRELRDAIDKHLGTGVAKRVADLHAPVQHMGQTWCGECSVRRSTGPTAEGWVAFIPHPCPTLDALNDTETTA